MGDGATTMEWSDPEIWRVKGESDVKDVLLRPLQVGLTENSTVGKEPTDAPG